MESVTLSRKTRGILLLTAIIGVSALFTIYSDNTAKYAVEALQMCAMSVIPSLFPFMVLSSIAAKAAPHLAGGGSRRAATVLSVILGALCGFPVGAATVAAMHKNGSLQKDEAEYLCGLCNNTGPAFVIGVIGLGFWGSRSMGIMFYICQIFAAIIVFCLCRILIFKQTTQVSSKVPKAISSDAENIKRGSYTTALSNTAQVFCTSVSESALSVISICGYIVFFKVICDTVRFFMPSSAVSELIYTVITSALEFTSGTQNAAMLGGIAGVALCGFSIGFSGLSVMAQSVGILSKAGLSARPLFFMKLFVGAVSAVLCSAAYRFIDFGEAVAFNVYTPGSGIMLKISGCIIIFAAIVFITDRLLVKR